MYSTKNIDKILIDEYQKSIIAGALNENTRNKYKPLNKEIALDYLTNEFSEAWKAYFNGHILYRGIQTYSKFSDFTYVIPGIRVSADTSNVYTKLISDILPSWKNYPKRNNSAICTTKESSALFYTFNNEIGDTSSEGILVVFPRNGTKIAVANSADVWGSFDNLTRNDIATLDVFNYRFGIFIKTMLNKIDNKEYQLDDIDDIFKQNSRTILNIFNKIEQTIRKITEKQLKQFLSNIYDSISNCPFFAKLIYYVYSGGTIIDFLDDILNPEKNGFSLTNINHINGKDNEVWFSSDYIMIKLNAVDKLIK